MKLPAIRPTWLRSRADARLVGFGLSALAAMYLGFIGVPVKLAEEAIKRGGYYLMAATIAWFLHALWRLARESRSPVEPLTRSRRIGMIVTVALLSLMAIAAEPYQSKILNDEFVLQSTAYNIHYFRDVATMVRGYDIQGVFLSTDNYLDKRPYLYPFLVATLHDLGGYRITNAYLLNSLLMPLCLGLAFAFGRRLAGWRGGILAAVLLGSLPLLGQNATGSGMELLNLVMILAALLLAASYLQVPSEAWLMAFLLTVVLLAQARYESALYVLPAALVVAWGWRRAGGVILPWKAMLVPWLLLPVALQNRVVSNSPVLWELNEKSTGRFDVRYFPENVQGAIAFLFHRDAERANSLTLSVAGILALGWMLWRVVRWLGGRSTVSPGFAALGCFSIAIIGNTLLVFCYYWARFDDPMAARFSLPLHLLFTFAVVLGAAELQRRWVVANRFVFGIALVSIASAAGKYGFHYYSHLGIGEIEWQRRYVNQLPPGERLIITNKSTLPWLLEKKPSILIGRAQLVADRLHHQLQTGGFREIIVLQTLHPSTVEGDHQLLPEDKLPPYFQLETMAERRFGSRISRVSRLLAVELPRDWQAPGALPPPKPAE